MTENVMNVCEYVLIRVAPDPIREEAVNVGVALYHAVEGGFVGVRINPDWRRVRQLSPLFDEADLTGLQDDLLSHLRCAEPAWLSREYLIGLSQESFGHSLQFTAPKAVLTRDPAAELDRLYESYVAGIRSAQEVSAGRRRGIVLYLEGIFRQERVLQHLGRRVGAADWLGAPDRYRFDFHYASRGGAPHFIQAVPLDDEGAVKQLCFTVGRLRQRVADLDVASFDDFPAVAPAAAPAELPHLSLPEDCDYHRELLASAGVRALALEAAAGEAARIRAALGLV
ncbi:MAG: DUF3037 domain-containing protein [Terriglobales bacterium]